MIYRRILPIFILALSVSIFLAFVLKGSWEPKTDGVQYDAIGWNVASGHGFSLSNSEPYVPTMVREPAYPIFLAIIYKLFGHNLTAVISVQVALFVFTCLLTYVLARDIFGERTAACAGILCAISPALADYPGYILSETLFAFLMCLSAFCINKAADSRKGAWFFASGISLGVTVLCKAIMALFSFFAVLIVILARPPQPKVFSPKPVRQIAIFFFTFLLLVGSWSHRNNRLFGTYQISLRGGAALWERAEKLSKSWQDMGKEVVFNFSEYLGGKIFPGLAKDPRDIILIWSRKAYDKDLELKRQGLSPLEVDETMRKEAVGKIRTQPLKFIVYIPMEMIKMTAFVYLPMLNEQPAMDWFHGLKHGNTILSLARGAFRLSAYPILILTVMGVVSEIHLWRRWLLFLAIILYINLAYSMLFAMGRYAVPLIPFYSIFAAAGLVAIRDSRRRAA